jgi:hypothetical protein
MFKRFSPDLRLALVVAIIGLVIGMAALAGARAAALQPF